MHSHLKRKQKIVEYFKWYSDEVAIMLDWIESSTCFDNELILLLRKSRFVDTLMCCSPVCCCFGMNVWHIICMLSQHFTASEPYSLSFDKTKWVPHATEKRKKRDKTAPQFRIPSIYYGWQTHSVLRHCKTVNWMVTHIKNRSFGGISALEWLLCLQYNG